MTEPKRARPHPTNERLAAWAETPVDDEVGSHVARCLHCRTTLREFDHLILALNGAEVHAGRAQAIARQASKPPASWLPWGASFAAAAAVFLVWISVPAPGQGDDEQEQQAMSAAVAAREYAARAGIEVDRPKRQLTAMVSILRESMLAEPSLRPVVDGEFLGQGPLKLAVAVSALPAPPGADDRAVVVWARDGAGRITWLLPSWHGGAAPPCPKLGPRASAQGPGPGVEMPVVAGNLELQGLLIVGDCDIRSFDARLEEGWQPPALDLLLSITLKAES